MALKTVEKTEKPAEKPEATVVLELALYTNYTWQNVKYEKGMPYRFKQSDAVVLPAERDVDRPIWKMYKPTQVKKDTTVQITDATNVHAMPETDEFGTVIVDKGKKRIDIGSDDEIADIIQNVEDDAGNVTV